MQDLGFSLLNIFLKMMMNIKKDFFQDLGISIVKNQLPL
jgi:hypothetical protein